MGGVGQARRIELAGECGRLGENADVVDADFEVVDDPKKK